MLGWEDDWDPAVPSVSVQSLSLQSFQDLGYVQSQSPYSVMLTWNQDVSATQ